jgi:acyl carrier protein
MHLRVANKVGVMKDAQYADIRHMVAQHLGVNERAVDTGVPLRQQAIGCDDLDVIEIIVKIENRYGIRVEDSDIDLEEVSVERLTTLIDKKLLGLP